MAIDGARSMKKVLRFMIGLLINVCILFALVKIFSGAYSFAYEVFANTSKDAGDTKIVSVEVLPDPTTMEVCESLEEAGVIDNKYAFMFKLRLGEHTSRIKAGTYKLSPSYTSKQIINILTGVDNTKK